MVYIWVFIICFSLGYTTMNLVQYIKYTYLLNKREKEFRQHLHLLKREEEFRQYLQTKLDEQSQQGGD